MSSVFSCSGTAGKLIALSPESAAPMSITIDVQDRSSGTVVAADNLRAMGLCTNVDIGQSVAAQFQNTFNDTIYVTPFGDLPGTVAISFLLNPGCDSPGFSGSAVANYFRYRLQPSYYVSTTLFRTPNVWLTIGAVNPVNLYGYIVGLQLRGASSSSVVVEGVIHMKAWKFG